jgi:hypothetical protein
MNIKAIYSIAVCFLLNFMNLLKSQDIQLIPVWETDSVFFTPESATYDSIRDCIYISNFNDQGGFRDKNDTLHNEFISKIDRNGKLIALHWTDGLFGPTGIAIYKDKLYAVERGFMAKIDIASHSIDKRYPIPNFGFPNDIAIAPDKTIYISDSEKNCIYRFAGDKIECWLEDRLFAGINGLFLEGQQLIVGNSNENSLLSVNITNKKVTVIATNVNKIVDGITLFKDHYITSGRTKMASTDEEGKTTELIEAGNQKEWYADFDFVRNIQMLVVPTLFTNRVIAFGIK